MHPREHIWLLDVVVELRMPVRFLIHKNIEMLLNRVWTYRGLVDTSDRATML
jgi:hypothetical protein